MEGHVILAGIGGVMILGSLSAILFWPKHDATTSAVPALIIGGIGIALYVIAGALSF